MLTIRWRLLLNLLRRDLALGTPVVLEDEPLLLEVVVDVAVLAFLLGIHETVRVRTVSGVPQ